MRKSILSMILCAVMLMSGFVLSSCGGGASSTYTQAVPVTVTLYSITSEQTTEEGLKNAQDAINAYTELQFGTHVELRLFTADEYTERVREDIYDMQESAGDVQLVTVAETEAADDTAEETVKAEETKVYKNRNEVVYPTAADDQVDIFLMTTIDEFNGYCAENMLRPLNDYIASSYTLLNKYLNPILFEAGRYSTTGIQYAIPNNRMIGEYEYFFLNKELIDRFGYDPDSLHTLIQVNEFIKDAIANAPDYTPAIDTYGVSTLTATIDGAGDFYGSYVGYGANGDTNSMPKGFLGAGKFQNEYATLRTLRKNGQMVSGELPAVGTAAETKAAVIFAKGNITLASDYSDEYYVQIYKKPTATNQNVYDGLYGISAYTKNADRCMEILFALQTNEQLRNIFQYGKAGTNYEINKKTGLVDILNNDYVMDPAYTGNQFLLWQNSSMTERELAVSADDWKLGKEHNKNAVKSPYCGFSPASTYVEYDDEGLMTEMPVPATQLLAEIKALCDDYKQRIDAYSGPDGEAFNAFLSSLAEEMSQNKSVKMAGKGSFSNAPLTMYNAWYKAMYKPSEEE